jgi:hypothetical protein
MLGRDRKRNIGGQEMVSIEKREHWHKEKKSMKLGEGQNMINLWGVREEGQLNQDSSGPPARTPGGQFKQISTVSNRAGYSYCGPALVLHPHSSC